MLARNIDRQSIRTYSDMVIFSGANFCTKPHAHHALKIIVTHDSPMTIVHENRQYKTNGVIIKADVRHQMYLDTAAVFLYVDPESLLGRDLNSIFKGRSVLVFDETIIRDLAIFFSEVIRGKYLESAIDANLRTIFFAHYPEHSADVPADDRISKAISFIRQNLDTTVVMKKVSEEVCLSESRLFHLFKRDVGIPIRKYILWFRVLQAILLVMKGNSLTNAAKLAGFSDLAHLNRTFVYFFGVTPSHVIKSLQ